MSHAIFATALSVTTASADDNASGNGKAETLSPVMLHSVRLDTLASTANASRLEISGLAWSADDRTLYAVGDEGDLLALTIDRTGQRINDIAWSSLAHLLDEDGRWLDGDWSDAEGMTLANGADGITGNSELLISFERHLRVCRYTPDGKLSGCDRLPETMTKKKIHRAANEALEAVFLHPRVGWITAPEHAPSDPTHHHLYAKNGEHRRLIKHENGAGIVCADLLADGRLLILERRYTNWLRLSFTNNLILYDDPFTRPAGTAQAPAHVMPLSGDKRYDLNYESFALIGDDQLILANDNNSLSQSWLIHLRLDLPPAEPRPGPAPR